MTSWTDDTIAANHVKWHTATSHSFLTATKQGTIEAAQFNRWLVQVGDSGNGIASTRVSFRELQQWISWRGHGCTRLTTACCTQDYFFVRGFTRLLGVMLGSCPDKHIDVLISGAAALDAELKWFMAKAAERGIDLAAECEAPPGPCPNCFQLYIVSNRSCELQQQCFAPACGFSLCANPFESSGGCCHVDCGQSP
jgi:hypothetical protein